MVSILVVDDERIIRNSLAAILEENNYMVEVAPGGGEALKLLKMQSFDVMVTDLKMEGMDGIRLLHETKQKYPSIEVIVLTAFASLESAVEATKAGAFDYLTKPIDPEKLLITVRNAIEKISLQGEIGLLKKEFRNKYKLENIVGKSKPLRDVIEMVKKIASSDSTVLIEGETGTGKQLIACAILNLSNRALKPFVELNCAALPQEIIESELFGHVKGAFTGAVGNKKGLFEEADGGTIFLDEIGATTLLTQVKLLKAIEEKTIRVVGTNKTISIDVRVIAATNRNLPDLIRKEEFRKDLYFRLNVISILLPSLRDRKEDIPLLCRYFLDIYSRKIGKDIRDISPPALRLLAKYDWPGNVRELEHMIEKAVLFCEGSKLEAENFSFLKRDIESGEVVGIAFNEDYTLEALEKIYIKKVLEKFSGHRSRTARELGIGRNTLAEKIKKYNIKVPKSD